MDVKYNVKISSNPYICLEIDCVRVPQIDMEEGNFMKSKREMYMLHSACWLSVGMKEVLHGKHNLGEKGCFLMSSS